jgi:diadenosine tetraphosphate (Ap4A) HIT family hydrolase
LGKNLKNKMSRKMINKFELVPGLAKKEHIIDLKLSTVLFEDNKLYPWVFLVPMRANVKNMTYLTMEERLQLMKEIAIVEKAMITLFPCDQTNVAMIGNKTPQLHVHIICRKDGDLDWPGTVWGNHREPYIEEEKVAIIKKIKAGIEAEMKKDEYSISD